MISGIFLPALLVTPVRGLDKWLRLDLSHLYKLLDE